MSPTRKASGYGSADTGKVCRRKANDGSAAAACATGVGTGATVLMPPSSSDTGAMPFSCPAAVGTAGAKDGNPFLIVDTGAKAPSSSVGTDIGGPSSGAEGAPPGVPSRALGLEKILDSVPSSAPCGASELGAPSGLEEILERVPTPCGASELGADMWTEIASRAPSAADAARLACVCKVTASAQPSVSTFLRGVRISDNGHVHPPLGGPAHFDVLVSPHESLQAAVNACPPGGSVLLLDGRHEGVLTLDEGQHVHIFGSPGASLAAAILSSALRSTLSGLHFRERVPHAGPFLFSGAAHTYSSSVFVANGGLRIQDCTFEGGSLGAATGVTLAGGDGSAVVRCRFRGTDVGISVMHHDNASLVDNAITGTHRYGIEFSSPVTVTSGGNVIEGSRYCGVGLVEGVVFRPGPGGAPDVVRQNAFADRWEKGGFLHRRLRCEHAAELELRVTTFAALDAKLGGCKGAVREPARFDELEGPEGDLFEKLRRARDGACILVPPGVYRAQSVLHSSGSFATNKKLTLFGRGRVTFFSDQTHVAPFTVPAGADVALVGLRIVHVAVGRPDRPLLDVVDGGRLTLQACEVESEAAAGVHVTQRSSARILASRIGGTLVLEAGAGASVVQRSEVGELRVGGGGSEVRLLESMFLRRGVIGRGAVVVAEKNTGAPL